MRRVNSSSVRLIAAAVLILLTTVGCDPSSAAPENSDKGAKPASVSVRVVKPERLPLHRAVRQPGSIWAFERTRLFTKIPGFVQKWNVDIGDHVEKGAVLAELYVPEMVVELKQKKALVQQAEDEITQAKETAAAAEAALHTALAKVKEAEASRLRAQAEYRRMKSQHERLAEAGKSGLLAKENVEEVRFGFEAAAAGLEEVEARIKAAQATSDESKARRDKARADVRVAEAHLEVARENRDYVASLLQYATLTAPFSGMVTHRNINTGDFVQQPTAGKGEPLYVVERQDIVRVFVEVPEADAVWVQKGTKAQVRVQALAGKEFAGEVTRTSYGLDHTARTLLAEIDLPNRDDRLRPGMYAYATLSADYSGGLTVPARAIVTQGDVTHGYQSFVYLVEDGKVHRTFVEIGARGSDRVEVLRKQAKPVKAGEEGAWENFTGTEAVVGGDLSGLSDGQAVTVVHGEQ
jgi:RND family efflux transporter MFP subunit